MRVQARPGSMTRPDSGHLLYPRVSMVGYRYSVVIPTKDRPVQVGAAVEQVLAQRRLPEKIVVVDASAPPWEPPREVTEHALARGVTLQVIRDSPSTSAQRNAGVQLVDTPIVLFLDDDIEINEDYAGVLLGRWDLHGIGNLGGVVGSRRRPPESSRGWIVRWLLQVHTNSPTGHATRLRASGKLLWVDSPVTDVFIPAVGAGAVSYRTELVQKHRFDERFPGYALGEDLDLAQRVSRDGPILQTPDAWFLDLPGPGGGSSSERWHYRGRRETYFRLKHIRRGVVPKTAFAVSIAGETLAATADSVRERDPSHVWKFITGFAETLKEQSTQSVRPRAYHAATARIQKARVNRPRGAPISLDWQGTRVLGYHRISDDRDVLAVPPARFKEQLEEMLGAGIVPVDLATAADISRSPDATQRFSVTFNSGSHDVLENAAPVLAELGIPALIYVASWMPDGSVRPPASAGRVQMLGWEDVRKLAANDLFEIGAHSRSLPLLPGLADTQAAREVSGSRADLEERLGVAVTSFCYPGGRYTEREIALVRDAGFSTAVTTRPGVLTRATALHTIPRTMIVGHDDAQLFRAKISGAFDAGSLLERRHGGWRLRR